MTHTSFLSRCGGPRRLRWFVGALGLVAAMALAGSTLQVFTGEDENGVWIEVGAANPESGFRLGVPPDGEDGTVLLFPDLPSQEEKSIVAGLKSLPSFRVAPSATGGTIVSLPLALDSLLSVDRIPSGWRFTFSVPGAGMASAEVPGDGEYRLGVRDVLQITVFGHEDLTRTETVPSSGTLTFPLIGEIQVAGRTTDAVQRELTERREKDYLVNPHVTVRVKEYESQWVNVVGQVEEPGKYYLKGTARLADVITEAGGLADEAGNDIVVTRHGGSSGGATEIRIDRDDLFSHDNEQYNIVLRTGDVIDVGEQEMFFIQGEVERPGTYPLEKGYTLLKAITVAGGFSQWADRKQVELLRDEEGQRRRRVLNLKAIAERKQQDIELEPEDIIIVKRRLL